MAYSFSGSPVQYLESNAPLTQVPLTLYGRVYTEDTTNYQAIVTLIRSGSYDNDSFYIGAAGGAASDPMWAFTYGANTPSIAATSSNYPASEWFSSAGVFASTNNRKAYLNGGSVGTNTDEQTTKGIDKLRIGAWRKLGEHPNYGRIAEVALWSVALTDAEVASLAKGFKPTRIRPQSLVFYAPLLRNLQDLRQRLALTAVNSPTVATHPRVY